MTNKYTQSWKILGRLAHSMRWIFKEVCAGNDTGSPNRSNKILRHGYMGSTGRWKIWGEICLPNSSGWEQQKQLCDKVWQLATWAKISTLWWIIFNQKLLSWDFLIMKGFMGPYMCMLWKEDEETLDHMLGWCREVTYLMDKGDELFRRSDRIRNETQRTIEEWGKYILLNPIFNQVWNTFASFLMWNIWKERNKIFFKNKYLTNY